MENDNQNIQNELPPIMGSWRNLYMLVLGVHLAIIAMLALMTFMYK